MSIAKNSIPEELRSDRNVSPYIHRAIELENVEPIISYFNKIYVLEYTRSIRDQSPMKNSPSSS